jgi:hypothetical protein
MGAPWEKMSRETWTRSLATRSPPKKTQLPRRGRNQRFRWYFRSVEAKDLTFDNVYYVTLRIEKIK